MRQLTSVLAWFYRQMLLLYPAPFRVIYGAEMEATFRRALEETGRHNPLRVLMLFLREVRDLPRSVVSVYHNQGKHRHGTPYPVESLALSSASEPLLARIEKGEATTALVPWPKVGLAILPGLYIFAVTWGNINWGVWTSVILLGICATVVLTGIRLERTLPVWGYPASGLSICIGWTIMPTISLWFFLFFVIVTLASWSYAFFCLVVERKRISWQSWLLVGLICVSTIVTGVLGQFTDRSGSWPDWWFPTISILETVAMPFTSWLALALMPLALRHGLGAALLVLGVGFWIWQFSLDFNYFLGGTAWANLMMALWTLLLLVVAPLRVLRTHAARQQEFGLLLPILIALLIVVPLETIARFAPHLLTDIIDLNRLIPNSGEAINGVGTRAGEPILPALLQNFEQARGVLIHWLFVIILYRSLGRVPNHPGRFSLSRLWNRVTVALAWRW